MDQTIMDQTILNTIIGTAEFVIGIITGLAIGRAKMEAFKSSITNTLDSFNEAIGQIKIKIGDTEKEGITLMTNDVDKLKNGLVIDKNGFVSLVKKDMLIIEDKVKEVEQDIKKDVHEGTEWVEEHILTPVEDVKNTINTTVSNDIISIDGFIKRI